MIYVLDGKRLWLNAGFSDARGIQYPQNWLELSSDEEKIAIGIEILLEPEVPQSPWVVRKDYDYAPYVEYVSMPQEEVIATFTAAIQERLDTFAQSRNYDGILSACTYATSAVPKFAAEGQYCVDARDATWTKSYEILADVEAGNRAIPTEAELMAELPVLSWPA